jgi:bacterioferritin (cytochrome b1)
MKSRKMYESMLKRLNEINVRERKRGDAETQMRHAAVFVENVLGLFMRNNKTPSQGTTGI